MISVAKNECMPTKRRPGGRPFRRGRETRAERAIWSDPALKAAVLSQAARCNLPTIRSKSSDDWKSMMIFPLSLADSLISTVAPSQSRN